MKKVTILNHEKKVIDHNYQEYSADVIKNVQDAFRSSDACYNAQGQDEQTTVPLGTFNTCHVKMAPTLVDGTTAMWVIKNHLVWVPGTTDTYAISKVPVGTFAKFNFVYKEVSMTMNLKKYEPNVKINFNPEEIH